MNTTYDEKYALFVASDCFMDTSIRGGINICALEYVYCRKGKPALGIISEFTEVSKTLLSAIRINPWHTFSVMEALDTAMSLNTDYIVESCRRDIGYIENNDAVTWVDRFIKELYYSRKRQDMFHTSWGFGRTYKTLSFSSNFQPLDFDALISKFKAAKRKLLFLDCEGTLCNNPFVQSKSFHLTDINTKSSPLQVNLDNLKLLSKEKDTVIVLISCRSTDVMDGWFSSLPNLGLCAERGYYFRLPTIFGHKWELLYNVSNHANAHDFKDHEALTEEWRLVAYKLFEQYVQRTPGSYLESKDSCLVFQYQNSDQEFGTIQANELNSSLSELMRGFPVNVQRGKGYLELGLKGINKGNALLHVVNKYTALYGDFDFILCIGDGKSDEETFKALETLKSSFNQHNEQQPNYISCVVGKRPSKANFFLNHYLEVADLLTALANAID